MVAGARRRGFTLVELLIVVVVLGILAGIVLPSFRVSTDDAKFAATVQNLKAMRETLDRYEAQHDGRYPGYPVGGTTPSAELAQNQLMMSTRNDGSTAAPGTSGYPRGPYLKQGLPANPYNGLSTLRVILDSANFPSVADDTAGWLYQPRTGILRANSSFVTSEGLAVYDL